jgi:nucleoside-diphosphate-sugar epimerase
MMPFDRNYKDSCILVTGGAGFIGSYLADGLKETIAYFRHSLELS